MEKPNPQSYHETDDARRVKVVIWISWRCSWKPMCRGYGDCVGLFFVHNLNDSWIYTPRLPNTLDLEVWLDPKNILETPSQEVFGSLGYMYMGCNRHHPDFFTFFSREVGNYKKKTFISLGPQNHEKWRLWVPMVGCRCKKIHTLPEILPHWSRPPPNHQVKSRVVGKQTGETGLALLRFEPGKQPLLLVSL